jgi:hypothetical protein
MSGGDVPMFHLGNEIPRHYNNASLLLLMVAINFVASVSVLGKGKGKVVSVLN